MVHICFVVSEPGKMAGDVNVFPISYTSPDRAKMALRKKLGIPAEVYDRITRLPEDYTNPLLDSIRPKPRVYYHYQIPDSDGWQLDYFIYEPPRSHSQWL